MISVINNHYVVQMPEYGVYQDIDPATGAPFADEAAAQAWADAFVAQVSAQQAAIEAARQEALAQILTVTVQPSAAEIPLGESVQLTATVKNGLDQAVELNDGYSVPIENEKGETVMIKRVAFADGVATVSFAPTKSGYFCITEAGINRRLDEEHQLRLAEPVEVVVYE